MQERTTAAIMAALKKKYSKDNEALEIIEAAEKDIAYIEQKEQGGNYTGQPSKGVALELEAHLQEWY